MATLTELLGQLDPDSSTLRGAQFERICRWFLTHDPVYAHEIRQVWLWDDWPGRWGSDAGIDLVAEDRHGKLWAIQAKAYAESTSITKSDVDSFISESARSIFSFRLLIATTNQIGDTAHRTLEAQEKQSAVLLRGDLEASQVDWPNSPSNLYAPPVVPKEPWPHQQAAIDAVVRGFDCGNDRGQLIMACGTGKTLTALFINEKLAAERTLVLVPSLALLAQTLREWTANSTTGFDFLPVCSDQTVIDRDSATATTSSLGFPVTTVPEEIAAFLREPGPRVVFATYQSSQQISTALGLGRVPAFDLVVADEAHRCAGRTTSEFGAILRSTFIETQRRLFMTATPRYFTGRIFSEAKEADFETASMDNDAKFGPVFHQLRFGEAIESELLTDYRVVVVGVDDATYRDWAERGRLVTIDGEKVTDARTLAGQIGLAKAMRRYDLRRIISFHSRIRRAQQFASELPAVIDWMPSGQRPSGKLWANHVSGTMPTGKRHVLLQHLANLHDCDRALLANARCLGEGIDVPAIDGVAFIDPRQSEVDIVQATGRAIRLAADKTIGTIIIPVFVDPDENPEIALDDSSFKPVWDVVKALRSHDETLGETLDQLRYQLGRQGGRGHIQLPGKIVLDLPDAVTHEFSDAFEVRLIEQTTATWEMWRGLLEIFIDREGHARVPKPYSFNNFRLGNWVAKQRDKYAAGTLPADKAEQLKALPGWTWDPHADQWEDGFRLLAQYVEEHGHARVPRPYNIEGYPLGQWVGVQRTAFAKGRLAQVRGERLQALPGWSWDTRTDQWEEGFARLAAFVEVHGRAHVQKKYVDQSGYPLGQWCGVQRANFAKGSLTPERAERLKALSGWSWDLYTDQWEEGFERLTRFVEKHGHARVLRSYIDEVDFRLGQWCKVQRRAQTNGALSADRRDRLESLTGWSWDPINDQWEEGFAHLSAFVEQNGHALVPDAFTSADDYRLGQWVGVQRGARRKGTLSADRRDRLESLTGWSWDPINDQWEEGFAYLSAFVEQNGHALVPTGWQVGGFELGLWVNTQRSRYSSGRMTAAQSKRLKALPKWSWHTLADQWEEGLARLIAFVEEFGHSRVPQKYVDQTGFGLGTWVATQRSRPAKGALGEERAKRIEESAPDWSWDPYTDQWEEGFAYLLAYVQQHGHARVSRGYVTVDKFRLGEWCKRQRDSQSNGKLTASRFERLDALTGWSWDPYTDQWEEGFVRLLAYVNHSGHARPPREYKDDDGYRLGYWVSNQRAALGRGKLSVERIKRLEALPGWA